MHVEGLGNISVKKAVNVFISNRTNSAGVQYGNIEAMFYDRYPQIPATPGYVDFLEKCEKEISDYNEVLELKKSGLYPEVGMGITYHLVTDCYAGTIVKVSPSGKAFWYTRDHSEVDSTKENDWFGGDMHYIFTPDPEGTPVKVVPIRSKKNGQIVGWKEPGKYGSKVTLGERHQYQDPSF